MRRWPVILLGLLLAAACSEPPQVGDIRRGGVLRVAFEHTAEPLLDGYSGPSGFEHDLAERFAEHLGVELESITVADKYELRGLLGNGLAHVAASPLPVNGRLARHLLFPRPFQRSRAELVYRYGSPRPDSLADLDGRLVVALGEGHAVQLERLEEDYPGLSWEVDDRARTLDLLAEVAAGKLDYTLAYSHELNAAKLLYPALRGAFTIGDYRDFSWALPPDADDTLLFEIEEFFDRLETSGELQALRDRYFGHLADFDYVEMREYQRRIDNRLPDYAKYFREAAGNDLDWRLLAAISYQESHWDPDAQSPTGVRGLMMLTRNTAKQVQVADRTDPRQSIRGGADYLRWVKTRIPERIREPDRTWFALATYNIGFGHLEDARILAERNGRDPDRWDDVRRFLPLLAKKKWYSTVKHGRARGGEAVAYVNGVRTYYDILNKRLLLENETLVSRLVPLPLLNPRAF